MIRRRGLVLAVPVLFLICVCPLWAFTIYDADLLDTTNFVAHNGTGVLNSRTDIAGDPGAEFNITFTGADGTWQNIQIGDNFDLPTDNAGLNVAGIGSLSASDSYVMTIRNPNTSGAFMANIYMNTGWTDPPYNEVNNYYEATWTWVLPGQSVTLSLDLSGVTNLNHVTDIGFQIGTHMGSGDYAMPSGTAFDVQVVPIPAAGWLFGTGLIGLIGLRRKKRR